MDSDTYNSLIATLAEKFAHAIATAEGFFVQDSVPQRANNPGDLELGDRGWGVLEGKTRYNTSDDGWAALERECAAMLTGASRAYSVTDTFLSVAEKWTGMDHSGDWCRIVTDNLNIEPSLTLAEWVKGSIDDAG